MAVMCARQEHYINRKRFQGIMKAYMECYMMLDRSLIFYDTETENIAEMAIEKVLASDAECILCMDDNICMIVLRILRKKGIQIPERIKVASLHNSSLLDEWYPPDSCLLCSIHRQDDFLHWPSAVFETATEKTRTVS